MTSARELRQSVASWAERANIVFLGLARRRSDRFRLPRHAIDAWPDDEVRGRLAALLAGR